MKTIIATIATLTMVAGVWSSASNAAAVGFAVPYELSYLTFSAPVRVPGTVLPAGTYAFKRVTPGVLQVQSRDRSAVISTFMTRDRLRNSPANVHEIVFGEAPAGTPRPILAWFPPDNRYNQPNTWVGYEFIY